MYVRQDLASMQFSNILFGKINQSGPPESFLVRNVCMSFYFISEIINPAAVDAGAMTTVHAPGLHFLVLHSDMYV